jgi:hypothetical protein
MAVVVTVTMHVGVRFLRRLLRARSRGHFDSRSSTVIAGGVAP